MSTTSSAGRFKAKALQHFRKPPAPLNCAQSTLKCAEGLYDGATAEKIAEFKAHGGGRSEGGACGALHAAKFLLQDLARSAELERRYIAAGGSTRCKELRALNRIPCEGCVGLAADFLEEVMEKT